MHFDKAFIIGLPSHTNKRLERCFKRCEREGVDAKLWSGIYGPDVDIQDYQNKGYLASDFELQLPGSLGCMLSHITLWETLEKDPDCEIALICEDDILLKDNFLKNLAAIPWSEVPDDWDIIKSLETFHIWNDSTIKERYEWSMSGEEEPFISLAILRVYKFGEVIQFPTISKHRQ